MAPDDDLIRGPKWRTRTTADRRSLAAIVTFVIIVGFGALPLALAIWLLDRMGAPILLTTMPWWLPTACVVAWTLVRPSPAVATDDDDDAWPAYAIRYVLVGDTTPGATVVRVLAAVVFGGPVGWSVLVIGSLALIGLE